MFVKKVWNGLTFYVKDVCIYDSMLTLCNKNTKVENFIYYKNPIFGQFYNQKYLYLNKIYSNISSLLRLSPDFIDGCPSSCP